MQWQGNFLTDDLRHQCAAKVYRVTITDASDRRGDSQNVVPHPHKNAHPAFDFARR